MTHISTRAIMPNDVSVTWWQSGPSLHPLNQQRQNIVFSCRRGRPGNAGRHPYPGVAAAAFTAIVTPSAEDLGKRATRYREICCLLYWRNGRLPKTNSWLATTGGTKTMSAALVMAPMERVQYSPYVSGVERD